MPDKIRETRGRPVLIISITEGRCKMVIDGIVHAGIPSKIAVSSSSRRCADKAIIAAANATREADLGIHRKTGIEAAGQGVDRARGRCRTEVLRDIRGKFQAPAKIPRQRAGLGH